MFESKVKKILRTYNFDPIQLFLVEKKDGKIYLRYQYYAQGEINKDINIQLDPIKNPEELLAKIDKEELPISFSIKGGNMNVEFKLKKLKNDKTYKGAVTSKLFRYIPVFWCHSSIKRSTLINLFNDLVTIKQDGSRFH